ncbi:MAG: DUF1778 domain-containing protein [Betaproteobacteria bacterium]|nr:DUF1778 domain-containing protein [Betaproteobacteria bacterium]
MKASARTAQLQIRVTPAEKAALARAARRAGLDMSAYVLGKALPDQAAQWDARLKELARPGGGRIALAGLSAWLAELSASELAIAVATPPSRLSARLSDFHANYVAAMVEHLCDAAGIEAPPWTRYIAPLAHPVFGSELASLRLHLLARSPPPFRRRNLFIDTAAGGQV